MTQRTSTGIPETAKSNQRLAILLAMAMFVLVVDTSLMNVSISAVVRDIGTTVSGVQSAIALEALVSAAFILIGSKVGDLIGRKLAYVLGLLGYAVGALAMAFAQSLTAIIVFWAVVGGLGASLLLPAMQSLIHGNFEGAAQKKAYALAADQDERGGHQRLQRDRGLHTAHRRVEILNHRRDRHVHQRRVDDEHEHRHRQQDREPLAAGSLRRNAGARGLGERPGHVADDTCKVPSTTSRT